MISVIIPIYNVEKYLRKCLDSVCNQNFKDLEIICVNDGSTDNSLEILKEYAKKDKRVKIIVQQNRGLGAARNTGLYYATGEYVLFVDSDDFLTEDSLYDLYLNAVSNDSDLVIFNFNIFNEDTGNNILAGFLLENIFSDVNPNSFTFSYKDIKNQVMYNYFAAWFKLYKKEFLDNNNLLFPTKTAYEDILFQIKSLLLAKSISFLPKYVYNYRESNYDSIMHDKSKIFDIIGVIDSVEDFLVSSQLFDEFRNEFLILKITQLSRYLHISNNEDYFNEVKLEFIHLDGIYDLNNLNEKYRNILNSVISSNNINEYLIKNQTVNLES